ncbi:MAG TPA: hypothetical protein PLR18_03040 [bacterium]|nr:hypothetical protein [bacterium]
MFFKSGRQIIDDGQTQKQNPKSVKEVNTLMQKSPRARRSQIALTVVSIVITEPTAGIGGGHDQCC